MPFTASISGIICTRYWYWCRLFQKCLL